MNLKAWREQRAMGEAFTLPSGLDVKLKRVTLLDLVTQGKIPTTLSAQANEVHTSGKLPLTRFAEFEPLINIVVAACIVEPTPELERMHSDNVFIPDLPIDDRLAVFTWAGSEAAPLRKFCGESREPVDAAQSGEGIRGAAE